MTRVQEETMANPAAGEASDYKTGIIEEFRANGGRVGGMWTGTIWAANGGSPAPPNWYHNLKANPRITVEVGTQTFTVLAQELGGAARAELWPKLAAEWPKPVAGSPDLGAAQAGTTRQFPVFMLTRHD
jgi:deazaflavin-dependent oxidoreductase (nitroreductase family)